MGVSKVPSDEETCRRKRNYPKKKAKHVLRVMQTNEGGMHGSIYKCKVCEWWHITSWPKNLYQKVVKEKTRHGQDNS